MNQFSVGFHKALKKILNVPNFYSNHLVCEFMGLVTLIHQLHIEKVRFIYKIFKNPPAFLNKNFNYFKYNSYFLKDVEIIFNTFYDVDDLLDNDFEAIVARVYFIHNRYNDRLFIDPG